MIAYHLSSSANLQQLQTMLKEDSPGETYQGTTLDNGVMESFFGILKTEMFYGCEKEFTSLEALELAISEYIDDYNNNRIKLTLKGLNPVQYRTQSFA